MMPADQPAAPLLFRNGGTSQAERQPPALLPTQLTLDGRTLDELLAYVARFSGQVQFYSSPAAHGPGGWALGQHRSVLLLALVATHPTEQRAAATAAYLQAPAAAPALPPAQYLLAQLHAEATLRDWQRQHTGSPRQHDFATALQQGVQHLGPYLRQAAQLEAQLLPALAATGTPYLTPALLADFGVAPAHVPAPETDSSAPDTNALASATAALTYILHEVSQVQASLEPVMNFRRVGRA